MIERFKLAFAGEIHVFPGESRGVLEYIVVCVESAEFRWFAWPGGERAIDLDGVLRSVLFPGLRIDTQAVLHGRIQEMKNAIENGLQHPDHAAFVKLLQSRKTQG